MRWSRRQWVERINLEVCRAGQKAVQTEHVTERQRAEAAAAFGQEFTTGSGGEDVRLSGHAVVTRYAVFATAEDFSSHCHASASFPLTLTLSLGEREQRAAFSGSSNTDSETAAPGFEER